MAWLDEKGRLVTEGPETWVRKKVIFEDSTVVVLNQKECEKLSNSNFHPIWFTQENKNFLVGEQVTYPAHPCYLHGVVTDVKIDDTGDLQCLVEFAPSFEHKDMWLDQDELFRS